MEEASLFYENAFLSMASMLVDEEIPEKNIYFLKLQKHNKFLAEYMKFGLHLINMGFPPYYRKIAMESKLYEFMQTNPSTEEFSIATIWKENIVNDMFPDIAFFQTIFSCEFNSKKFSSKTDYLMKRLLNNLSMKPKFLLCYVPIGYELKDDFVDSYLYENKSGDTLLLTQYSVEADERLVTCLGSGSQQLYHTISMWENQTGMLFKQNDEIRLIWNVDWTNCNYQFYLQASSLSLSELLHVAKNIFPIIK